MGAFKIIFSKIIGFLIFLILLGIANLGKFFYHNILYIGIVEFFTANIFLLFILFIIGMVNDLFWLFKYNILAPIVSAGYSLFIIEFFYRISIFITAYQNVTFNIPIILFYIIIPVIVLIGGYVLILSRLIPQKVYVKEPKKKTITWNEIGLEFKKFFYNTAKDLNKKKKRKKKKA
jgi:hypothetical protein